MRIGKQDNAHTAIATSDADSITIRGEDLCADLIGKINFTDYFWLLVLGERCTPTQRHILDACLVAIAEHGLVPSVQAARMTLAAGPEAWQGAMAAGLLGMGSVVAGSSETAGLYLDEVLQQAARDGTDVETAAKASLAALKAARKKVPGLGHPQHSEGDPRANRLLEIADELGVSGRYVSALRILAEHAPGIIERPLPI
ncbi:MAG: citryl-CoA lyase, partial [Devosia sp.]